VEASGRPHLCGRAAAAAPVGGWWGSERPACRMWSSGGPRLRSGALAGRHSSRLLLQPWSAACATQAARNGRTCPQTRASARGCGGSGRAKRRHFGDAVSPTTVPQGARQGRQSLPRAPPRAVAEGSGLGWCSACGAAVGNLPRQGLNTPQHGTALRQHSAESVERRLRAALDVRSSQRSR